MSELEIKRRQEYKRNRKKWSIIQIIAIAIVATIALGAFLIYDRMNDTYYIEYTENSSVDYKVQYEENDYFDEEWIDKENEYISKLIESITADFRYKLNMQTNGVGFEYKYKIDATLLIADKTSGRPYRTVTENILPLTTKSIQSGNSIEIKESINIDFNKFHSEAIGFVETYFLRNSSSTLIVTLDVEVLSTSKTFQESNENKYSTSLNIPVALETFGIEVTASVPSNESKVLAYSGAESQGTFLVIGIVASIIAFILALVLVLFLHITKNEDVTYAAKIRKIVNAYGSYIQRMDGEFNEEGYQIVMIKTFNEMLGIRDTIQSPILMTENRDETMTRFLIPTNTKILYTYEIKVDNYDFIYGIIPNELEETPVEEAPIEETSVEETPIEETSVEETPIEETIILSNDVSTEEIVEALAQPDIVLSEIEYVEDNDAEFEVAEDEPGVEVIGVVWPERAHKNKVYRYDPNGEELQKGDIVLVPTRDAARDRNVIRKAAVAHENHRVDPEHIKHPLKKIIGVIKRKAEEALTSDTSSKK